jgi:carbonic anhydrase
VGRIGGKNFCRRGENSVQRTLLGFVVPFIAVTVAATLPQDNKPAPPHWTYQGGEEDPRHWGDLDASYATCKLGHQQSPIDISKTEKSVLDPILFSYHASPLKIIDNGHTVMVTYTLGSSIAVGGHEYSLKQFHFHHPSEEKVNGKSSDMVVHLVHADAEGKLAVVAVLLKVGSPNSTIQTLWDNLPKEKNVTRSMDNVIINATQLVPADHGYYTFMGSLTTPPCAENVTWFVLKSPLTISADEVDAFAKVYPLNTRPTQPLNDRTVRETK